MNLRIARSQQNSIKNVGQNSTRMSSGLGVFARRWIAKGTILGQIDGKYHFSPTSSNYVVKLPSRSSCRERRVRRLRCDAQPELYLDGLCEGQVASVCSLINHAVVIAPAVEKVLPKPKVASLEEPIEAAAEEEAKAKGNVKIQTFSRDTQTVFCIAAKNIEVDEELLLQDFLRAPIFVTQCEERVFFCRKCKEYFKKTTKNLHNRRCEVLQKI